MAYNAPNHAYVHGSEVLFPNIRLICGDSTKLTDIQASIVYTDPPWNDAILNKFYSLGGIPGRTWAQLMASLAAHISRVSPKSLYVEMGLKSNDAFVKIFSSFGWQVADIVICTYGATKTPFALNVFSGSAPVPEPFYDIPGAQAFLSSTLRKDDVLYDPCAGEGYFLVPGVRKECIIIGCEMIPDKFASMVKKISRIRLF